MDQQQMGNAKKGHANKTGHAKWSRQKDVLPVIYCDQGILKMTNGYRKFIKRRIMLNIKY